MCTLLLTKSNVLYFTIFDFISRLRGMQNAIYKCKIIQIHTQTSGFTS